jgi:23S rRNA (cytosine1962-C5)-methyltransferase
MSTVQLKPGREKSLLRRHPWVFSGAIDPKSPGLEHLGMGETVELLDSRGNFLARGAYSPQSQIRIRIWTWEIEEQIDTSFFHRCLQTAINSRQEWNESEYSNACRLVYGESDGLPGLIVDQYQEYLVLQITASGVEKWREDLADSLNELTGIKNIYERSDVEVRKLEGLPLHTGVMRGSGPPDYVDIMEEGIKYLVDIYRGQKTGFYLDQKSNRKHVRELSHGCEVLDCFSYTGGFALNSLMNPHQRPWILRKGT